MKEGLPQKGHFSKDEPLESEFHRVPIIFSETGLNQLDKARKLLDASSRAETVRRSVQIICGLEKQYKLNKNMTLEELMPLIFPDVDNNLNSGKEIEE